MISVKKYNELKEAVEAKQQAAERAQGAFDQALKQLQTEFKCATIDEAKAKLVELQKKEEAAAAAFEAKLKEFQEEYGHVFNE